MKHLPPAQTADSTPMKAPTRRTLAKQQTRAKVLAAARRLFSEAGYEGATIRDIAREAGMSTGAVFANFSDKSDLFREIMLDDMTDLAKAMRDAAAKGQGVADVFLKMFSAGYAFYRTQLPLARAAFSVGWSLVDGPLLRTSPATQALHDLMAEQLTVASERGELVPDAEVNLRSQMLFDAYLANYSQAIFDGWTLAALEDRSRQQIQVILAGARAN